VEGAVSLIFRRSMILSVMEVTDEVRDPTYLIVMCRYVHHVVIPEVHLPIREGL